MNAHELIITRTIKAPRSAVFNAFTQKSELEKWFCPEGMTLTMDELEVKEGGTFLLHMTHTENGSVHTARGTYQEVKEPENSSSPGNGRQTRWVTARKHS